MLGFLTMETEEVNTNMPAHHHKPHDTLLAAASAVDDHDLEDVEIPLTDIYTQEFFLYAYSFLSRDRKGYYESTEGLTYIKQQ
jgi:hypothetical protein